MKIGILSPIILNSCADRPRIHHPPILAMNKGTLMSSQPVPEGMLGRGERDRDMELD